MGWDQQPANTPTGRIWPNAEDGENYREVFEALEKAGYEGRVSIEAGCKDMAADAPKAYQVLKAALEA